jgi:hypothetical protein
LVGRGNQNNCLPRSIEGIQNFLLEGRVLVQSIYRDVTGQIPPATTPPVLLVQIDDRSIAEAGISDPYPMDPTFRRFLNKENNIFDNPSRGTAKCVFVNRST